MSTDFRPTKSIAAAELFDGRLEKFYVRVIYAGITEEKSPFLTDDENCICVYLGSDGYVNFFTRYGLNDPNHILYSISEVFQCDFHSDDEPQFWGYETWDEVYGGLTASNGHHAHASTTAHS